MKIVFLFIFPFCLYSQVQVTFIDQDKVRIPNMTVEVNKKNIITDTEGSIVTVFSGDTVHIVTSHVSFNALDTFLFVKNLNKYELSLSSVIYNLPLVDFKQSKNIEERTLWNIKDFSLLGGNLIVLSSYNNKESMFYKFDKNGDFISKVKTQRGFNKLHSIFMTNNILVTGKTFGKEISGLNLLDASDIYHMDYYQTNFFPFIYVDTSFYILSEQSRFNKMIQYNKISRGSPTASSCLSKVLYEIYDKTEYAYSKEEYNNIISKYYQSVNTQSKDDINYGMAEFNIIKDGNWSGNVSELINEDNNLHKDIANWTLFHNGEVPHDDIIHGDNLFIIDGLNHMFVSIDIYSAEHTTINIKKEWKNYKFIPSNNHDIVYFGDDFNIISYNLKATNFETIKFNSFKISSHNKKIIIDENIFILSTMSSTIKKYITKRKIYE